MSWSEAVCHRIMLVDEVDFFSNGVRDALSQFDDPPEVVAVSSRDLPHMWLESGTVVLFDLPHPVISALAMLDEVVRAAAPAPVAVFAADIAADVVLECFRRGARGLVSKSAKPARLIAQLDELASGAMSIDSRVGGELARFAAAAPLAVWPGRERGLSQREGEVLVLLAGGLSNREISERLIVGVETVKSHARAIYRKLGVRNRVEVSAAQLQ